MPNCTSQLNIHCPTRVYLSYIHTSSWVSFIDIVVRLFATSFHKILELKTSSTCSLFNAVFACCYAPKCLITTCISLHWHHNGRDSVSNHQPHDCLLNRLFRRRSKKTSKLRVTGLCVGNSPRTGEFPAQMASNAENVSIWWRHHVLSFGDTDMAHANDILHRRDRNCFIYSLFI